MSTFRRNPGKTTSTAPAKAATAPAYAPPPSPGVAGKPLTRTSTLEAKPTQSEVTTQAIAEAAYFLWLKRGGNELVNWLEAEAALKAGARPR